MPTYYEIPTIASPQTFSVTLAGVTYFMTLKFCSANADSLGPVAVNVYSPGTYFDTNVLDSWVLDISDQYNNNLISGIPLVAGIDLLYQYAYLGIGGSLFAGVDGDPSSPPNFSGLGTTGHLYFVTYP